MIEEKLVIEAMNGNGQAFEELLKAHSDQLYRTAYLYAGNREDALDIVQETAYKAFLAMKQLKKPEYFLTWLTKILIRCSYETLNKRKSEIPSEQLEEKAQHIEYEKHMDLAQAISKLKEKHRTVIILFYYQDQPISMIAEIMKLPENTVKTHLARAKKHLKKVLERRAIREKEIVSRGV